MLADLRVSWKLLIAFATMIVAVSLTGGLVVASLARADHATGVVRNSKAAATATRSLFASVISEQNAIRGYVISQNETLLAGVERQRGEYVALLAQLRSLEHDPVQLSRIAAADALVREWRANSADQQVALARDPQTRAEAARYVSGQYIAKIQSGLDEVIGFEDRVIAKNSLRQDRALGVVQTILLISAASVILLAGGLCWLLNQTIAVPVGAMTEAMNGLAAGDHNIAVPARDRCDELGQMAGALQVFKDAALAKAQRQAVVLQSGNGLARLSDGDLGAPLALAMVERSTAASPALPGDAEELVRLTAKRD